MTRSQVAKLAGLLLIVGPTSAAILMVVSAIAFPNHDLRIYASNPAFAIVNLLLAIATAVILFALPILIVARSGELGVLGLIGFALIFVVGLMFGVFIGLFGAVIVPVLGKVDIFSGAGPSLGIFFIGATLFEVVGSILLAVVAFQHWGGARSGRGYLFALAAIASVLAFLAGGPGTPNVALALLSNSPGVFLMLALLLLGYELWAGPTDPAAT